jgi:hypothetical protein
MIQRVPGGRKHGPDVRNHCFLNRPVAEIGRDRGRNPGSLLPDGISQPSDVLPALANDRRPGLPERLALAGQDHRRLCL